MSQEPDKSRRTNPVVLRVRLGTSLERLEQTEIAARRRRRLREFMVLLAMLSITIAVESYVLPVPRRVLGLGTPPTWGTSWQIASVGAGFLGALLLMVEYYEQALRGLLEVLAPLLIVAVEVGAAMTASQQPVIAVAVSLALSVAVLQYASVLADSDGAPMAWQRGIHTRRRTTTRPHAAPSTVQLAAAGHWILIVFGAVAALLFAKGWWVYLAATRGFSRPVLISWTVSLTVITLIAGILIHAMQDRRSGH
jgi:hypothetical protein